MRVNWVGVRNLIIIAGIAGLALVAQELFADVANSLNQIILVLFIAAIAVFAYNYFRQNQLAWLVLKTWQRWLIIVCGAGIAVLVISSAWTSEVPDRLTWLGVVALIGVLALIIVWIIRESRRFRM